MAKVGRPTDYTEEVAARICEEIAEGKSIRQICEGADMPVPRTIWRWLAAHQEFSQNYARAKEEQAEYYSSEIIDIADDGSNDTYEDDEGHVKTNYDVIQRSKLRVDTRKWIASKLLPKKYGDLVRLTGADAGPVAFQLERIDE
jgi:transposase-like protein